MKGCNAQVQLGEQNGSVELLYADQQIAIVKSINKEKRLSKSRPTGKSPIAITITDQLSNADAEFKLGSLGGRGT